MILDRFYAHQAEPLRSVLEKFYDQNDDEALKVFIADVQCRCNYLDADAAAKNKYLKVLAHFCKDKIFNAYWVSRRDQQYPEIVVRYNDDLRDMFEPLGLTSPGSQQDVLYTLTSERAGGWVPSLTHLGFRSAYMSAPGQCTLITTERLLNVSKPHKVLEELKGSIAADFFTNLGLIKKKKPDLVEVLEHFGVEADASPWSKEQIEQFLANHSSSQNGYKRGLVKILSQSFYNEHGVLNIRHWNKMLKAGRVPAKGSQEQFVPKEKGSQEQLVLKYMTEANLLQKFLDGKIVDHVQSNLKMQPNPMRGNKVEVDSVYGVIGASGTEIIIVEAKDKPYISNTQLYGLYETYRLRLPPKCQFILVAALLGETPEYISIDLVKVSFSDQFLTDATASILNMEIDRHYKWKISK